MKILIAKTAGFCFGVKRAIKMAYRAASSTQSGKKIYTLGPLIHNPQVVKELEKSGVLVADSLNDIDEGPLIIRSHGVTSSEMENAKAKKLKVIDATCPFVKKAQEYVRFLSQEGYHVVIVGEKAHPEVKGLVSYAVDKYVTVATCSGDIDTLPKTKKVGIVVQTTQPLSNLQSVVSFLIDKIEEVRVFNTICSATSIRQKEAVELAAKADCMIVVGGYNSANTNRLAEICREILKNTHHIEVADEIRVKWLNGVNRVAVTGGASTPPWIMEAVCEKVKELGVIKKC
ncbi:MAG: 4-hydroxy-3-methylbut-2-enyl diphosphate reductase [Thermodesulfobacteriota bacterium]